MSEHDWQRARAGEHTFVYLDSGEGPLVVLVHGFPDTPESWDAIRAALNEAGYRTVAPYLRGYHPDTLVPGRRYRAGDVAEDALVLLDALDAPRATLVGHDWGAAVVYGAAALAPDRLAGIVPVAIPHPEAITPSPRLAWAGRHFVAHKMPWAGARARRDDFAYLDRLISRWSPDWSGPERDATLDRVRERFADPTVLHHALAYYRDLSPRRDPDLSPPLRVSALVVGGDEPDLEAGYRASADLFEPPAEVTLLDSTGHWPHREAEPAFIEALIGFLDRTAGDG